MIDAILYRVGLVRTARAKSWVEAAVADGRSRAKDQKTSQARRYQRRLSLVVSHAYRDGLAEGRATFGRSVQEEVTRRAGEIEAERNGYKAQWEQAERRLKVANRRLQQDGKLPVTSFV